MFDLNSKGVISNHQAMERPTQQYEESLQNQVKAVSKMLQAALSWMTFVGCVTG
jgi:hypothetical protein